MSELWVDILCGVIIIVTGLLVKRFPILIAGYNTMPAEKKKNVDIEGLSSFMCKHLVIIGALWIGIGSALHLAGEKDAIWVIYIFYMPVYLIWMLVRAQRYDHNGKQRK